MRLATFNVENLFDRAKALRPGDWKVGRPVLEAYTRLNRVLNKGSYSAEDRRVILELAEQLGVLKSDEGKYVRLRRIRGRLLKRPKQGGVVEVVASGRADWTGWVELKTERVDELAIEHTARVIRDVGADVLGVVEAENRIALKRLSDDLVAEAGKPLYPHVMVIDGNDDRGIDVGVMTRAGYDIVSIRSHVDDRGPDGRLVFGRDCPEYEVSTPGGESVTVLVNHFKSKGYGRPQDSNATRRRQAERVAEIYNKRLAQGRRLVAVVGDLNDTPSSAPLEPLVQGTDLRDVSEHDGFDDGGFPGTYGTGTASNKIDYVMLSPGLFSLVKGGGVFRRGVWTASGRWPMYDTLSGELHAASDHAAVYADLDL